MNPNFFSYVPKHIVLRRYEEINIYDFKNDESYIIDDEAYSVLKLVDGITSNKDIIKKFPENKKQEVSGALNDFHELSIIESSPQKITDKPILYLDHLNLTEKNPFEKPFLKNLMINVTEKCNLTCRHCYITNKNPVDFPLKKLKDIIKDFYDLQGIKLILTGGEPFLYSDLKELLIFLKDIPLQKVMLSNGVLIKEKKDKQNLLKQNHFEVFVSIDGLESSHNAFRNANCFKDSIDGIKLLLKENIKVSINTMVHKQNLNEFDDLLKLIKSLGPIVKWAVDIPTLDNLVSGSIINTYGISAEEGGQILKDFGWGDIYESESHVFACGPHIMAIDVLGIVTKCGFFYDENVGNVFELGLKKSWESIQKNLNWKITELKCAELNCEFLEACRGGCRYRALQATGDIYEMDSYKCYQFGKLNK